MIYVIAFFIFISTLKFELFTNACLLVFFFLNIKKIYFSISGLKWLIVPYFSLLIGFLFFQNLIILKYIIYVLRFLIILFFFDIILKNHKLKLSKILSKIYYIHVFTILLSYIFPAFNKIIKYIFSYQKDLDSIRYSGLISGYDFVSFIVLIYLSYEFYNTKFNIKLEYIFKLFIGLIAILLSGRFGIIPLSVLVFFIIYKTQNKTILITFTSIFFLFAFSFFSFYFQNIVNTYNVIIDYYNYGTDLNLSDYNFDRVKGQYNFSFINLFNELTLPLKYWNYFIFPTKNSVVDPGLSYLILNLGYIITAFMYYVFFKLIKIYYKINLPLIVVIIFLLVDIKFRSLYVLLPTIWLLSNHINYIKKNS